MLRLSTWTVASMTRTGRLPRVGGIRPIRIPRAAVLALMEGVYADADAFTCDHPECGKLRLCQSEDSRHEPTDSASPRRAILPARSTAGSPSATSPSGRLPTARSRMDTKSTTSTATSRTTDSTTSSSLIPSPTSAFTPAANSATESGGSPAASAESSSGSALPTGTSLGKDGRAGTAGRATSHSPWSHADNERRGEPPLPKLRRC